MTLEEFKKHGYEVVDWIAKYYQHLEDLPVRSQVTPGTIKALIPDSAPEKPEPFEELMRDLDEKIIPGVTHWQHPNFHAYFPGNSSFPSILGEMLTSAIGAQCMIWETSPAAAELEEKMMDWFKKAMGLPPHWHGVIQDTASTATLVALLCAREAKTDHGINERGFEGRQLTVFCSEQAHSSVDKAVKIAGIGIKNLRKIPVSPDHAMNPEALRRTLVSDRNSGLIPCAVITTLGTTGTLAFDPLPEIAGICREFDVWHHVDAAYAGSAFVLPEYRNHIEGIDQVDSYLFNPHKWFFTNFDCTAYFVKDKEALIRTFDILPEYLKTGTRGKVNDYRDWGVQLGRRFRALKVWFVLRSMGIEGIREKIRHHINMATWLENQIQQSEDFEIMTTRVMNVFTFRYCPDGFDPLKLDHLNAKVLSAINDSGEAYLTHARVDEQFVIRMVTGQTYLEKRHVQQLWKALQKHSKNVQV